MTEHAPVVLEVFAPDGIGEVGPGADLADLVAAAVTADPHGPLRDGDVVVVTSKVVSKAEGRAVPAADREAAIDAETAGTVARRGATRIVRTRAGLTLAAAGVDASNVPGDQVLLLPVDPDRSAARLRAALRGRTGVSVAVVVSDTAGRPWRLGQTDLAIGAAGLAVLQDYAGHRDRFGHELRVTAVAVADEIAAAADLVKAKLAGRPVAVVRGLGHLVGADPDPGAGAAALVRPSGEDLFGRGTREAVLYAVLRATDQADRYEELAGRDHAVATEAAVDGARAGEDERALLRRILAAAEHPGS